jgi:hypothetical protein
MKKALIFFFILATSQAFCQNNIQNEIMTYKGNESTLINNGRRLLLDKFVEGDLEKVHEIKNYLINEVQGKDYTSFGFMEYWLLLYWTREYEELAQQIAIFNDTTINDFAHKIKPTEDFMLDKILSRSRESEDLLQSFIQTSDISSEQKDFLSMNLKYLLNDPSFGYITQDSLNVLADRYLKDHPKNAYEYFTRKYIRCRFVPSQWAFSCEFFSGFGKSTGEIHDVVGSNIPLGIAMDVCYRKLNLYLRDYMGIGSLKENLTNKNTIWDSGSKYILFIPEASLGYTLTDNKRIKLAPFVGISGCFYSAIEYDTQENPNQKDMTLDLYPGCILGMNLDIKLKSSPIAFVSENEKNTRFIRLRYSYCIPDHNTKFGNMPGNIHTLTLGFGWFGQKFSRQE